MPVADKRKRGPADVGVRRPSPSARSGPEPAQEDHNSSFEESHLRELLVQNNNQTSTEPTTTGAAETAAAALDSSLTQYSVPSSFAGAPQVPHHEPTSSFQYDHAAALNIDPLKDGLPSHGPQQAPGGGQKPSVGSDEWHRVRRDNHKEVERRRREAINEGINELSKIVPGCEKNKGSILQRAVQYIGQLKENEQQNIEKWTLEKLLLDQAITELSATAERLKNDSKFYQAELERYKAQHEDKNSVPPDNGDEKPEA